MQTIEDYGKNLEELSIVFLTQKTRRSLEDTEKMVLVIWLLDYTIFYQSLVLCRQKWSFLIKIGHLLGVFCSQLSPMCWNPKFSYTRKFKSRWMGNLLTYLSTQLVFSCKWINIIGFYEWPLLERNQQAHHVNENSIAEKAICVNYADK